MITVQHITKTFRVARRNAGLKEAVKALWKREYDTIHALNDISFTIGDGEMVGYIGPNGAGKSSTIKVLSGILTPDTGQCDINGRCPWKDRSSHVQDIGVVFGQRSQLWWDVPVIDSFELLRDIYRVPQNEYKRNFDELVELLNLSQIVKTPTRQLSLGQRMRCEIAASLLHSPKILFLDEPTNHLDIQAVRWLEDFLADFEGTVLVVSHDRHFLNNVCTHIVDIDYGKIKLYVGNYEFWYESSQLIQRMIKDQNRKNEEKIKELQNFIQRFAANKSKSRQATSRRKLIDKLTVEELPASSRRYPWVAFQQDREAGKDILEVRGISKTIDGEKVLDNVSFIVRRGDKIAFISDNELAMTTLFQILMGEIKPDEGSFKWGVTTSQSYFPKDNNEYFEGHTENMLDWIAPYSQTDTLESTLRGFLGRMLFSGDDVYKPVRVLSGGEKVRLMLARMMLFGSNVLVIDQPTNHLDLESITAVNNGVRDFKGTVLFASHDHEFVQTIATRIIEIREQGVLDKECTYDEFLEFRETYKG